MKRLRFSIIMLVLAAGLAALAALSGCGSVGVQVWERDVLARSEMQFDSEQVDRALDDHIYFSREASAGGRAFGGGGCGCN